MTDLDAWSGRQLEAPSRSTGRYPIDQLFQMVGEIEPYRIRGRVRSCRGTLLVCGGLTGMVGLGDTCLIEPRSHNHSEYPWPSVAEREPLLGEVVAVDDAGVHLLPFSELEGIGLDARVTLTRGLDRIRPSPGWLGRVLDPLARPLDRGPAPAWGSTVYPLQARPAPAHQRRGFGPRLDLGVRALNLFTPCCRGQRMGIFAGSGVGKSTLLSMLARHSNADALVLGLIGERGREVNALLQDGLDSGSLDRSVVVVATSDMPAMLRRRAAYLTLCIAEALRDQGLAVLCLIDSMTRFAMALREIYPDFSQSVVHRALNRRKSFFRNDLEPIGGEPRCRQSVIATCSDMKWSKGARWWPPSTAVR